MSRSLNTKHGFSLIELITAIGISGIVLAAVTATFISQSRSYDAQAQINGMQQAARVAMDMITREVRMAGYNPANTAFTDGIPSLTDLRILADLDGNGDITIANVMNEDITYSFEGAPNRRILRDDANDGNPPQTLVENIEAFTFVFFKSDPVTGIKGTPATPAEVAQVEITITSRTAKSDPNYTSNGGYRTFTLTSLITPRNLAY